MENRYKVTADPMEFPMYFQGSTEDEAWEKAKKLAERNGMSLYNGKVEKVPTEAEKDTYISELEAFVKWYIKWAERNTPENKLLIEARKTLEQKPATRNEQ